MEQRPYTIRSDAAQHLIVIRFEQVFWQLDVADRFRADVLAAVAALHGAPGTHLVLVDLRNAVLQSQDTIDKMKTLIGGSAARRIALIAEAPLARMQTKRLQLRDNVVLFAAVDEARAWLFGREERAAA